MKKFFTPPQAYAKTDSPECKQKIPHLKNAVCAAFFLLCAIMSVNAYAQTSGITLNVVDQPISAVLDRIEKQSNYSFFYNNKLVKLDKPVSLSVTNASLDKVLDELLSGTNYKYSIADNNIVLSLREAGSQPSSSAPRPTRLDGRVVDANGAPAVGATVVVAGTTTGTTTGADGTFSISRSEGFADARLDVRLIGFVSQLVPVNNRTNIEIRLAEEDLKLEAVVVTALGIKRQERSISYNVQSVGIGAFATKDVNLINSLSGKLAGVQVNASSAGVGGESKVVIRGNKSIRSSNNALYVLDGIPLPELSFTQPGDAYNLYAGTGSTMSGDGISNFNSEDLSNMTVLSGPSASALYGHQGANGVVMLNTRGTEKGFSVNVSNNTQFSSAFVMPDFQTTYGASEGSYESWGAKLASPSNWNPASFFQTGYTTSTNIGVGIGKDNSSTYISGAFTDARGLVHNNDYRRYNFTLNHSSSHFGDKLTISAMAMYMDISEQNMIAGGQFYNPIVPVYVMPPNDDLEKYAIYQRYDPERHFSTQYWPWGERGISMQNPYWIMNRNMFNTDKDRFLVGASLKYQITDWLDVTARGRIDHNRQYHTQKNYASTNQLFSGPYGRYFQRERYTKQSYADVMVNFNKNFCDKLSVLAAVGASVTDATRSGTFLEGDIAGSTDVFTVANIDNFRNKYNESLQDQSQALFATASIGWDRFVYLDLTARYDWHSAMVHTDYLPILYPSVGLSTILTDAFKIHSHVLSFLKVRASYAEVGNPVPPGFTSPTYSAMNPYLSWGNLSDFRSELTKSWEIGLDAKLWGNKLTGSVTYYSSRTYSQIYTPQLSRSTTKSMIYANSGRIDNHGVELKAEVNQRLGPVDWNTSLVYSLNRNKIVEMFAASTVDGYDLPSSDSLAMGGIGGVQNVLRNNGSIGDLYVNTLRLDEHGNIWVAPNADNNVEAMRDNYIYAGNTMPSWNMSWSNSFTWKGIRLGFMFAARVGGIGVSATQSVLDYYGVSRRTAVARDEGGALVNGQRITAKTFYQTIGSSSGTNMVGAYYVYSMTNVRLGELNLSYDIPVEIKGIKNINVGFVGRNLWMLYCKAPFDPEVVPGTGTYQTGIDYFNMPSTRNLGFSVRLTF